MNLDNLVQMANRIGEFFQAMPDPVEAGDGVAQHLRKFWEPRMRRELLAHVDAGGAGLLPIVLDAVRRHHTALAPAAASQRALRPPPPGSRSTP